MAAEAARERRRSRRQEAHTPLLLLKSTVCLLHLIGRELKIKSFDFSLERTFFFFLGLGREFRCYSDVTTCKDEGRRKDLVVKILSSSPKISVLR